jgi:acetylornithine/succinyldiaminopimelate/putrescine aminotransferase
MNYRQLFLQHVAQTSPTPIGIEMKRAQGVYLFDVNGKEYIDAISGFSVANIGHSNPRVIRAVQQQVTEYMHLIVYGEFIQQPQVAYAKLLTDHLPASLNCVYFTNSGAEAVEGAMKLAKRVTNRTKIISFNKSYHGSTQGALSISGDEYWRNAFRPLLPDIYRFDFGSEEAIEAIDNRTACIIMETVQAEAGIIKPAKEWIRAIRGKCDKNGVLLVLDEVQAGFGRTGSLWAFEQYNIVPDILLLGKAIGGGMPLGAFIADKKHLDTFTVDPILGHITTFGGHPVSCAAGMEAMKVLLEENYTGTVKKKEQFLISHIQHPNIRVTRSAGLWMAVEFDSFETNHKAIQYCIRHGVISDWFLFAPNCMRIAPPLSITEPELEKMCSVIVESIEIATAG